MNFIFRLINTKKILFSLLADGCYTKNLAIAQKIALFDLGASVS